ncbi:aldo/keto reductase [Oceanicaulis sp. LC35]|uniref:aldo/keto reductase n=1 Tax=Oceanicaulis sp. LC35 TaxID=3349635 RepID=UPI003F85F095
MVELSPLGFGVSGAHGTPLLPASQTQALIEAAVAGGVRYFDTAPSYGAGECERRLGRALRGLDRSDLVISTKVGLMSHGLSGRRRDLSPEGIEASLRASLDRLGVEGVDLLIIHGAALHELTWELKLRLDALKQAGAFRWLGAAGRTVALDWALDVGMFDMLMAPVHPFLDAAETATLDRAAAAGVGVVAIETAGDAPPVLRAPRTPSDLYSLGRRLRGVPAGRGRIATPDGLAQALKRPGVVSALFTTTRPAHLQSNIARLAHAHEDDEAG